MGAHCGFWPCNLLAAACFAVMVAAGANAHVDGAPRTALKLASAASCPHASMWKPTEPELQHILVRHFGWLEKRDQLWQAHDEYLDRIKPAYPGWQHEARSHPEQANLCNANLSDADLTAAHLGGANLSDADLTAAHLGGADLTGANLTSANLTAAKLGGASLDGANLTGASSGGANLTGASLGGAFLTGANLGGALLPGAFLYEADLGGADLTGANLTGADLTDANLAKADLRDADVSKAKLAGIDLTGAYYARFGAPDPDVGGISGLGALHLLGREQIAGLVQLRKALEDAGLRDDEREVTNDIEHTITQDRLLNRPLSFAWFEGTLRLLGFDVTTAYGLHPERALSWILLLGFVLTFLYTFAIPRTPKKTPAVPAPQSAVTAAPSGSSADQAGAVSPPQKQQSGIYQVFPSDRIDAATAEPAIDKDPNVVRVKATTLWDAFCKAAYFSLLSAVNIGFEQFTPGDWLRRLQSREYSLEAVGWVRIVAGAQALLSVYLLAMWALTQFGRPFE
jgi:hypothetical protein